MSNADRVAVRSNALEHASAFFEAGVSPDMAELMKLWVMFERGLLLGPAAIREEYVTLPATVRLEVVR